MESNVLRAWIFFSYDIPDLFIKCQHILFTFHYENYLYILGDLSQSLLMTKSELGSIVEK